MLISVGVCCVRIQFWVCTCIFLQVTIVGDGETVETVVDGETFLTGELLSNTEYTYRVLAINGFGDGEASPDLIFRTNFGGTYRCMVNWEIFDRNKLLLPNISHLRTNMYNC